MVRKVLREFRGNAERKAKKAIRGLWGRRVLREAAEARKIRRDRNPTWDLTPYQGDGLGKFNARWRLYELSGCVEYKRGRIDENGKLIGLPNQFKSNYPTTRQMPKMRLLFRKTEIGFRKMPNREVVKEKSLSESRKAFCFLKAYSIDEARPTDTLLNGESFLT